MQIIEHSVCFLTYNQGDLECFVSYINVVLGYYSLWFISLKMKRSDSLSRV